jgi:hypothetical protein
MKTTLLHLLAATSLAIGTTSCGVDDSPQGIKNGDPIAAARSSLTVDPFDSQVFNWLFYVNNYADLLAAGIRSEPAARSHWTLHGIAEGRQASPTFHTRQYLELYADLRAAFGSDYRAALDHYLTYGISERRQGFRRGGAYGRYTVANDIISVSSSDRTAGAIDSIVWNGRELVNSFDHGRQVQLALSVNGWGECYNPTEAGGGFDESKGSSTSQLLGVRATGSNLATTSQPAFWMLPGVRHPFPSPDCTVARNTSARSNYRFSKDVQVGVAGIRQAIQFLSSVYVPDDVRSLTLEAPTGYLAGDFTSFYTVNLDTGVLSSVSPTPPGEQQKPLVVATPDGSAAMGAWSPELPQVGNSGGYGKFAFPSSDATEATNKWNIVFRHGPLAAGTIVSHRAFLVVGSLENVRVAMKQLYDLWRSGGLP